MSVLDESVDVVLGAVLRRRHFEHVGDAQKSLLRVPIRHHLHRPIRKRERKEKNDVSSRYAVPPGRNRWRHGSDGALPSPPLEASLPRGFQTAAVQPTLTRS